MVIKRSAAREIQSLVQDLADDSEVRREAAVARLAVIGARAVEQLCTVVTTSDSPAVRAAALRALEAIASPRALDVVLGATGVADETVAVAAVNVLRSLLPVDEGHALDRLAALALDPAGPEAVRLAALDALSDVPREVVAPILGRLREDPSAGIRTKASPETPQATPADPAGLLEAAALGRLPEDPEALRTLVANVGKALPLPTLHRLVVAILEAERREPRPGVASGWMASRAAVHHVLAGRGSRVALYDLRETIERADGPVSVEFVAALEEIGDVSCLDAIAAAYMKAAGGTGGQWWRQHLVNAFHAIARREQLTRRHAAVKRLQTRWGAAADPLLAWGEKKAQSSGLKARGRSGSG